MLANLPAKRIQKLYASVNRTENILKSYSALMELIEKEHFNSAILQACKRKLGGTQVGKNRDSRERDIAAKEDRRPPDKKTPASSAIKRLSRHIGALDQRFSAIGILLNLVYMRDTRQAIRIEKWKTEHSADMKEWFEALGVIDAFCSVGTFAFNHPDYIYPSISESYFFMDGTGLGHPLLHRDKCVRNDIQIPRSKYFLIITGANMAGKSTYLRTAGVNFLLACMGMPVCAETLAVYPAQMREGDPHTRRSPSLICAGRDGG